MTYDKDNIVFQPKPTNGRFTDLTNTQFGDLLVKQYVESRNGKSIWLCECSCGNTTLVGTNNLKSGGTHSCGCWKQNNVFGSQRTHGQSRTPLYAIWRGIMTRCYNPKNHAYRLYGERGIKVCERWHTFDNFYADIPPRPSNQHSIDRINNDGDYSPENCKWSTQIEQTNNTRRSHMLTFQGKTQSMKMWANELSHLTYGAIQTRLYKYNWSVEKTLTTPIRQHKPYKTCQ